MLMFDFNAALGRFAHPAGGAFDSADDLLDEMRRLRIDEALVTHALALEGDVEMGNRLLLEALNGHERLHPCWVAPPPTLGDFPEPGLWVREAREAGVRAARMTPAHSLFSLSEWRLDAFAEALEHGRLPLLLDFGDAHWSQSRIPWQDVAALCTRRPRLNVVVVGPTIGDARDAVPLLTRFPNLHLECHAFALPDGFPALAAAGLSGRLLFGTGIPRRAGECPMLHALRNGMGAADESALCFGNAHRLLGLPPPPGQSQLDLHPVTWPTGAVIDVHAHFGAWERTYSPVRRPEDIVTAMHRCEVHKLIGSNFAAIHGETRRGNRQTAEFTDRFRDYLYGYCVINPNAASEMPDELAFCFEEGHNFVGLKFHCGLHAARLQDPGYGAALEYADAHQLPVLVHQSGADAWEEVAGRYPRTPFIIAHACGWDGVSPEPDYVRLAREFPNIYLDVAGSAAWRGALRALVERAGLKKVLLGSDYPMFDLAWEVGRVAFSPLSEPQRMAVAAGNATRIFKRVV